ncbi:MAG: TlpA family protein disulfide reductase [Planctomycetota bacterium]
MFDCTFTRAGSALLLLASLGAALPACTARTAVQAEVGAASNAPPAAVAASVGEPVADFTLKDAAGQEHSLSDFRGRVVLLDFWASWCGPCRKAMPEIAELAHEYAGKGVEIVGVAIGEPGEKSAEYMKKQGFDYKLFVEGDAVAKQFGVQAIPTVVILDRDGRNVFQKTGAPPKAELVELLDKQLAGS